jgi:hypothetical protein
VQAPRVQLVEWLQTFHPDDRLRKLILDTIDADSATHGDDDAPRRRELHTQLERLRDVYVMGDLSKPQYVMRRQAIEEELQRTKPPTDPNLDRAQALLEDFARFWTTEPGPAERRKLVAALFDHIWQRDGAIVAVKPNPAFARYFTAANQTKPPKTKQKSGVTKAGATGVRSGDCTSGDRDPVGRAATSRFVKATSGPKARCFGQVYAKCVILSLCLAATSRGCTRSPRTTTVF